MSTTQYPPIKKIAISTGGGDAPGLNAVIRAAAISAMKRDWEVYGVRDGFNGILSPEEYPEGGFIPLTRDRLSLRAAMELSKRLIAVTRSCGVSACTISMH